MRGARTKELPKVGGHPVHEDVEGIVEREVVDDDRQHGWAPEYSAPGRPGRPSPPVFLARVLPGIVALREDQGREGGCRAKGEDRTCCSEVLDELTDDRVGNPDPPGPSLPNVAHIAAQQRPRKPTRSITAEGDTADMREGNASIAVAEPRYIPDVATEVAVARSCGGIHCSHRGIVWTVREGSLGPELSMGHRCGRTSASTVWTDGTTKPWETPARTRTATRSRVLERTKGVRRARRPQETKDKRSTTLPPYRWEVHPPGTCGSRDGSRQDKWDRMSPR